ncbi:hypothetical protein EBR21_10370 [bacterium]|nr:hypothetical protein [bacterium]
MIFNLQTGTQLSDFSSKLIHDLVNQTSESLRIGLCGLRDPGSDCEQGTQKKNEISSGRSHGISSVSKGLSTVPTADSATRQRLSKNQRILLMLPLPGTESISTREVHMDVRTRSVLVLTLGLFSGRGIAANFHESLQPGVVCSSENYPVKFEILELPQQEDGFFKVSDGLCRALNLDEPDDTSTLFPVARCIDSRQTEFTLYFGGWLNMLTARFSDNSAEKQDLICR